MGKKRAANSENPKTGTVESLIDLIQQHVPAQKQQEIIFYFSEIAKSPSLTAEFLTLIDNAQQLKSNESAPESKRLRTTPPARAATPAPAQAPSKPVQKPKKAARPTTSVKSRRATKGVQPKAVYDEPKLLEVEKELQVELDAESSKFAGTGQYRSEIGEGVLCLSHGYYYESKVISRGPGTKDPNNPNVKPHNLYSVRFPGWGPKYDSLVAENYVIMRKMKAGYSNLIGMLFAHEWNTMHYTAARLDEKDLGQGFWLLSEETYQELERIWQEKSGHRVGFSEYCGRLV